MAPRAQADAGTAEGGATLRDVARRAGVSISTVSRVLGGSYPARGRGPVAVHRVLGTHLVVRDSVRPRAARQASAADVLRD